MWTMERARVFERLGRFDEAAANYAFVTEKSARRGRSTLHENGRLTTRLARGEPNDILAPMQEGLGVRRALPASGR